MRAGGAAAIQVIVRPGVRRSLRVLTISNAGFITGFYLCGLSGKALALTAAVSLTSTTALTLAMLILGRPAVVIGTEGFSFLSLWGETHRGWEDVAGSFRVIDMGYYVKVVGYDLTEPLKDRRESASGQPAKGCDETITGPWDTSAADLAELLNARKGAFHRL